MNIIKNLKKYLLIIIITIIASFFMYKLYDLKINSDIYKMSAICIFTNNSNKNIKGSVVFKPTKRGLQITVTMEGLKPGLHGFHIHQYGDLSEGCGSLCSHFNPTNSVHGSRDSPERHLGDLENIIADNNGRVNMTIYDKYLTLTGKFGIIGRSVVVHEDEDDLGKGGLDKNNNVIDEEVHKESLKTGNAGKRIACGVIGYKKD